MSKQARKAFVAFSTDGTGGPHAAHIERVEALEAAGLSGPRWWEAVGQYRAVLAGDGLDGRAVAASGNYNRRTGEVTAAWRPERDAYLAAAAVEAAAVEVERATAGAAAGDALEVLALDMARGRHARAVAHLAALDGPPRSLGLDALDALQEVEVPAGTAADLAAEDDGTPDVGDAWLADGWLDDLEAQPGEVVVTAVETVPNLTATARRREPMGAWRWMHPDSTRVPGTLLRVGSRAARVVEADGENIEDGNLRVVEADGTVRLAWVQSLTAAGAAWLRGVEVEGDPERLAGAIEVPSPLQYLCPRDGRVRTLAGLVVEREREAQRRRRDAARASVEVIEAALLRGAAGEFDGPRGRGRPSRARLMWEAAVEAAAGDVPTALDALGARLSRARAALD